MDMIQVTRQYLRDFAGEQFVVEELPKSALRGLPLYLAHSYMTLVTRLYNRDLILLLWKDDKAPTPRNAKKDLQAFRDHLQKEVALVMNRIPAHKLKRFRDAQIPYIVPDRHLYLPMFLLEHIDYTPRTSNLNGQTSSLEWSAQVLLLRHLLFQDAENQKLVDLAAELGYSAMSMSKARNSLAGLKLCEIKAEGRLRTIRFPDERRTLWARSLPHLRSPIKQEHFVKRVDVELPHAGVSALARETSLGDDIVPCRAVSTKEFVKLKDAGKIIFAEEEYLAEMRVEEWHYDPRRLTRTDTVDRLSLYLSIKEHPDERVQIALRETMERFPW